MKTISETKSHGGIQGVYAHESAATGTEMTFAVFVPPHALSAPCPVVTYLSGLTCTHANVMDKGEYRRMAAELGLVVVCPDTSPRGEGVANDEGWDMGQGAGFYLDATQDPWSTHFRMETYIRDELPRLVSDKFPVVREKHSIFGHSMGGHGALTLALKNPDLYRSASAFAPIVAPIAVPWGQKALPSYLGEDEAAWRRYDACALIEDGARFPEFLVDQGMADSFLEAQLQPERLEAACAKAGIGLTLNRREGYDHSYFFIQTFMDDHLRYHAAKLAA
ncbi:S-formylglutathione hydrolase [Aureimonas sp. Leaf454]|uniref:S-formylglutathione hydrolase n=1 Tax=Aureimonas sp. Leaf454 TaxID=1736381 RepID=UPI0006FA4550|nr:S-formylglutathione hydrolase [Aureimonas sp. Leaf454]KQT48677.1 S-formylglutathione hydrolase [Aureimonas sp. Leaf454]